MCICCESLICIISICIVLGCIYFANCYPSVFCGPSGTATLRAAECLIQTDFTVNCNHDGIRGINGMLLNIFTTYGPISHIWLNPCVTFHGIYSFPRDSFIVNISMHFWATLDMTCSGSQGDIVSPVRGGAGRALCEERLLSRSLCGDLG